MEICRWYGGAPLCKGATAKILKKKARLVRMDMEKLLDAGRYAALNLVLDHISQALRNQVVGAKDRISKDYVAALFGDLPEEKKKVLAAFVLALSEEQSPLPADHVFPAPQPPAAL